jgi:hypothetical protein
MRRCVVTVAVLLLAPGCSHSPSRAAATPSSLAEPSSVAATITAVTEPTSPVMGTAPTVDTGSQPTTSTGLGMSVAVMGRDAYVSYDPTGAIRFTATAGMLSGDHHQLISTVVEGSQTFVDWTDSSTGQRRTRRTVSGTFALAAVSFSGHRVALADASYQPPRSGELATSRTESHVVVVSESDEPLIATTLDGNLVAEAFTQGRDLVAMIEYLPANRPTKYRVRLLDLAEGQLLPPFKWNTKEPLDETMAGLRGSSVVTEGGRFLYTLYRAENGTAFVHALGLDIGTQHCIDLPADVGLGKGTGSLAASVDGRQLYVLTSTGKLVMIDTNTQSYEPHDPAVVKVTDLGQSSTSGRLALALNARVLYASLDDHVVTVNLTSGAIAQSSSGQVATALVISPTANAVLAANDTSIWRLNSSEAPIRLPKSLGAVHLVMSV